eukprot:10713559-Alexandrium_andersonii.AAC.1
MGDVRRSGYWSAQNGIPRMFRQQLVAGHGRCSTFGLLVGSEWRSDEVPMAFGHRCYVKASSTA